MQKENIVRDTDFMHFHLMDCAEGQDVEKLINGDGRSDLLLIISEEITLSESLHAFLSTIMRAAGIESLDSVQLLQITPADTFSLATVLRNRKIQRCILFGAGPRQLQLHIPHIRYRSFDLGGVRFLFSDSLSDIQHSKSLKKELWDALRELFNLNT